VANDGHGLSRGQIEHLARRYGTRTAEVMALIDTDAELKQNLVPGMPDIWAEAAYAARSEMALRADDVLFRRTKIGLKEPAESSKIFKLVGKKLSSLRGSAE